MGVLTRHMQEFVRVQRLGFVATVCPDGTPNLSPKGTTTVWDEDHLVFADIASPDTVKNLERNPAVEINVVDPVLRKGYRFKGTAEVLAEGPLHEQIVAFYQKRGVRSSIRHTVLIRVRDAQPLVSPVYATGATEEHVCAQWEQYWAAIHRKKGESPTGE